MLETFPELRSFLTHWRSLPKEGLVPSIGTYLDNPPLDLQPYVAISDLVSEDNVSIRLMGTALTHAVGERTGTDIRGSYEKEVARLVARLAWIAVRHPAGYLARRRFETRQRAAYVIPTITLPLLGKTVPQAVITFFGLDSRDSHENDPRWLDQSRHVEVHGWIDVGAGIPAPVP